MLITMVANDFKACKMGSRRDLMKTIEEQQDKLGKYENRLRDVVLAYKGLSKEKEALEASLKALASPEPVKKNDNLENEPLKNEDEFTTNSDQVIKDELSKSANNEVGKLRHQITTLTNALSTLSAEKARMESSFQADKKRLRQEKEESYAKLEIEKVENDRIYDELKKELNELKMRLKTQQQDRDKEESNHALMLRELQTMVSTERMSKEYLQEKLDEAQASLKERDKKLDKTVEYERKLQVMSEELETLRKRLQKSEDIASKPSPMLMDLQSQMGEMKQEIKKTSLTSDENQHRIELTALDAQHVISFQHERLRADEAENKLMCGAGANEDRVAALELKLSELSILIGNYDRMRIQDQQAILKLKERVAQLDLENATLAKAAKAISNSATKEASEINESHLTVQELLVRISKLKGLLKVANHRAEIPVNTDDVLKTDFFNVIQSQTVVEPNHSQCQLDLQNVKEEFENYKLKNQAVLKKNIKDGGNMEEVNNSKKQISEMKEKIIILRFQLENEEFAHKKYVDELKESFAHTEDNLTKKMIGIEDGCKLKICTIEKQMQGQRERTMTLLEEKDEELNDLKLSSNTYRKERKLKRNEMTGCSEKTDKFENGSEVMSMLSNSKRANKSETQILHYQQEISRQDVEIKSLRKAKRDLESSLREIQNVSIAKEEKYCDRLYDLQSKLGRLELGCKESANLEYLKNVVVNFMCSTNANVKLHMLKAIAAVLHFTPKEHLTVKHHIIGSGR
ncbi:GRIP and coiled-coil domain-containing protein 1 [Nymphon striatum]|nr:GRIP and coiled-coil domain-containing protein 1 [Nymphon striatum]